jgi:hypothetical protein
VQSAANPKFLPKFAPGKSSYPLVSLYAPMGAGVFKPATTLLLAPRTVDEHAKRDTFQSAPSRFAPVNDLATH